MSLCMLNPLKNLSFLLLPSWFPPDFLIFFKYMTQTVNQIFTYDLMNSVPLWSNFACFTYWIICLSYSCCLAGFLQIFFFKLLQICDTNSESNFYFWFHEFCSTLMPLPQITSPGRTFQHRNALYKCYLLLSNMTEPCLLTSQINDKPSLYMFILPL